MFYLKMADQIAPVMFQYSNCIGRMLSAEDFEVVCDILYGFQYSNCIGRIIDKREGETISQGSFNTPIISVE